MASTFGRTSFYVTSVTRHTRAFLNLAGGPQPRGQAPRSTRNACSRDGHRFSLLFNSLSAYPTRLQELVPQAPLAVGACDACQHGMGGVWLFPDHTTIDPVVRRAPFPVSVSSTLVTSANPTGQVSISDFELADIIAHKDIATACLDMRERTTLWIASDNRAAVAWSTKGSSTSISRVFHLHHARAYLLQYNALHQHQHRYIARHHYIPGPVNAMADDAGRRWDLTDDELLTHFNIHYPRAVSWTLRLLPSATNTAVIGALLRKQRRHDGCLASATPTPARLGVCENTSAPLSKFIPRPSEEHRIPCLYYSSLLSNTAQTRSLPAVTLSAFGQRRMPNKRLARRMPGWGPLTLA